jgi:hypothetical protein
MSRTEAPRRGDPKAMVTTMSRTEAPRRGDPTAEVTQ